MIDDAPDTTTLVHAPAPGLAAMTVSQARDAMQMYREMCQALLTGDDMQRVGDRSFVKRSGFSKLAAAYGVSTEIISLDVEHDAPGSGDGERIMLARARVRAIHPSGRYAEGDGACASNEKRFRRGDEKIEHSLPATAVTRATNRAVSNLIAFGTVSAEEAEGTMGAASGEVRTPAWAAPVDVGDAARALHDLLAQAGITDQNARARAVTTIGNRVLDQCGGEFPVCVATIAGEIAAVLHDNALVEDAKQVFDATEEPTTAPVDETNPNQTTMEESDT
jgi:predicted pyridoxine 5'-phosphate oxidase superfamily flavin-nucleotide-binding protein